jgi:4'-phosphopantetheinyl transferase
VSHRPIGVDVESIREFRDSLVDYTMSEEEARRIRQSARPSVEFIRLWTMKESLLKLSGEGIRKNLKDVLTEASTQVTFTTVVNIQKQYIYSICEYR